MSTTTTTSTTNDRALADMLDYPLQVQRLKGEKNIATLPPTTTSKGWGEITI